MADYLANVGIALSRLGNSLIGGNANQSLSARIGLSILGKGLWARAPLPLMLRDHFLDAAINHAKQVKHDNS